MALSYQRMSYSISWVCIGKQANQFDNAIDLHFFQNGGAVFGHGLLANAERVGYLFGVFSGHQPIEHLALTRG